MELRHIRYFVRAAEFLHFTQAAESLYISQPSLSTHIHQLEEELGVALFDRVGRNVKLTAAGQLFLDHSVDAMRHLDVAKDKITDLKNLVSGTLRLGALSTFGYEVLPSWIASFHERYPGIRIVVQPGTSDVLETMLQAGEVELALSFLPAVADYLEGEELFNEQVFLVVGQRHPLAKRTEIAPTELGQIPLALVSRQWAARRVYDAFLFENNVSPNVLIEIDDLHALLRIVRAGKAASLMARLAARSDRDLVLVPIAGQSPRISYGVLWNAQGLLSPPGKAFLEHIKTEPHQDSEPGSAG